MAQVRLAAPIAVPSDMCAHAHMQLMAAMCADVRQTGTPLVLPTEISQILAEKLCPTGS